MATNVFGKPVTDGNRMERALEAFKNPDADGKRDEALAYVTQLKQNSGTGVSTPGIFYNATGETLFFTLEGSWYGKIHDSFPTTIHNGQWGAFLHIKTTDAPTGSAGFVVYRVKVDDIESCNQLISWSTPWEQVNFNNQTYCDIFGEGNVDAPNEVYMKMDTLDSRRHVVMKKGMRTTTKIEEGTSPLYEVEFTREDVATSPSA